MLLINTKIKPELAHGEVWRRSISKPHNYRQKVISWISASEKVVKRDRVSRLPELSYQNFQKLLTAFVCVEKNTYFAFVIYHRTATLITMRSLSWKSLKFENKRVVVHGVSAGLLCALPKEHHPENMVATTETYLIYRIDKMIRSWTALAGIKAIYSCFPSLLSYSNIPFLPFIKTSLPKEYGVDSCCSFKVPFTHYYGVLSRLLSFNKKKYYNAQWLFGGCTPFQIDGWIENYRSTRMATAAFLHRKTEIPDHDSYSSGCALRECLYKPSSVDLSLLFQSTIAPLRESKEIKRDAYVVPVWSERRKIN